MRNLLVTSALLAFPLAGSPVSAQSSMSQSKMVQALGVCRSEMDEAARLRCYDAAAAALVNASATGEVLVVDREEVRKSRRSLFGFNLPKISLFNGDGSEEDEADEVELTVRSFRQTETGKYLIQFEDGSNWQTTEVRNIRLRAGDQVKVKKAALGSYFLTANGRSVRGMRVR